MSVITIYCSNSSRRGGFCSTVRTGPVLSYDELFTERIRIKGGTPFFGGFPNQLLTDSWAVGSRRADRWSALDYATTSGSGSRMSCLDVRGTWGAQRKIIDCSSKRFSTDLELGVLGVIYRSVSAPGKRSINVFSRWAKSGVFERIFQLLSTDCDNEYMMIDATIVRAHQHSAGARKKTAGKG